ncbi:MAG TPA: hypothetical protein PKY81_16040 [bacterium]|nr:hypothetical protein [bacterium]
MKITDSDIKETIINKREERLELLNIKAINLSKAITMAVYMDESGIESIDMPAAEIALQELKELKTEADSIKEFLKNNR